MRRLYDEDAYLTSFSANVISCEPAKNPVDGCDCFAVVLDATAFFPEQGGQGSDQGTLASNDVSAAVTHVSIDEESGLITHYSEKAFAAGTAVSGAIDFGRRFSSMQNHSGEHIFSGLVHRRFGYDNVGFHLSDDVVTMDYNGPLTGEEIAEVEAEANAVIWKNIPVKCWYPDPAELASIDYRSKKELTGPVRIVKIGDVDTCACCAPHVKATGEIGSLVVTGFMKNKGGVRLSILCGQRALAYFSTLREQAGAVSQALSTPVTEIAPAVRKVVDERAQLSYDLVGAQQKILKGLVASVPASQNNVILFTEVSDTNVLRRAVNALTAQRDGFVLLLSGPDGAKGDGKNEGPGADDSLNTKYRFILSSSKGDSREALKTLQKSLTAKGGGSAAMVQGTLSATRAEIEAAFATSYSSHAI